MWWWGRTPDAEHIGGLISVLEQVSVVHYLDAGQHVESFTGKRLLEIVQSKGASPITRSRQETV